MDRIEELKLSSLKEQNAKKYLVQVRSNGQLNNSEYLREHDKYPTLEYVTCAIVGSCFRHK